MTEMDICEWCGEDMPHEQGRTMHADCEQQAKEDAELIESNAEQRSLADSLFGSKMDEDTE